MSARLTRRRSLAGALVILVSPVVAAFLALSTASAAPNPPNPAVSFGTISAPLIGQSVGFDVSFVNSDPNAAGYGPYIDLRLPLGADGDDGLTFTSATYLGASVTSVSRTADAGGCVTHPYAVLVSGAPLQVCGLVAGQSYVVLRLPFGSFTPGQPAATVHVTAALSNLADTGTGLDIGVQGGFQFGADPLNDPATDPSLTGTLATKTITPTVMRVTKTYGGPEDETATGPNYPRTYTIRVSIAPGQTVQGLVVSDSLPGQPAVRFHLDAHDAGLDGSLHALDHNARRHSLARLRRRHRHRRHRRHDDVHVLRPQARRRRRAGPGPVHRRLRHLRRRRRRERHLAARRRPRHPRTRVRRYRDPHAR